MVAPVVIVGASLGGLRTAESLRKFGYVGPIEIFGDEPYLPYNRPPLSKEVLAGEINHEAVAFPLKDSISDVVWHLSKKIVSVDVVNKRILDDSGGEYGYSALVIATGLSAKKLTTSSENLRGVHVLRNLDDAITLRADLKPNAKVAIVGSGFIGCEVAATAIKLGCKVSVITSSTLPLLRPLGQDFALELKRRLEARGINFLLNSKVSEIVSETQNNEIRVKGVRLGDESIIECEVLIVAIGSSVNSDWLASSPIDISDGVLTNGAMQALDRQGNVVVDVYAVGDIARFPNPIFDDVARRVEHWNIPTETAKRVSKIIAAGLNQADDYSQIVSERFAPIPSFWSDLFEMHLLGYGNLNVADEIKLLNGAIDEDFVYGYFRNGLLVGVSGIGMRSVMQAYREKIMK